MKQENRINFDNVKVNDIIEIVDYGKIEKILIYKVNEIDEKIYKMNHEKYYKLIKCDLIKVPNANMKFYKECNEMKKYIVFFKTNFEYLTLDGHKLIIN